MDSHSNSPADSDSGAHPQAIAIVGMAGRFPGAGDVATFWRNLLDGVESITRYDAATLVAEGADPAQLADPRFVAAGAALADIAGFDAAYFAVSPRDATRMDPQLRLFLECAAEALADAGQVAGRGGAIGLFAGASLSGYLLRRILPVLGFEQSHEDLLSLIGTEKDYLPTFTAYKLGLTGPCVGVQTACSTGLVAVHLACQSLLAGECDVALAGGSTVKVPQRQGYVVEEGGYLARDGVCRTFDAEASGAVFGSGVGVVVLRRLDDALADGDAIVAVIRGSAINNDGAAKVGFTAPAVDGQAAVIAEALAVADVAPASVGYVEAHGTATALGDPIEVAGLKKALGVRPPGAPGCGIGSVKTNVGHLECAAGVAGIIKAALAVRAGEIPASLHFRTANPHLGLAGSPLFVCGARQAWPAIAGPRRAGVSSFGMGGTNAHVVLEQAPARAPTSERRAEHLLVVSARSDAALTEVLRRMADRVEAADASELWDICYTAGARREHHSRRAAVVGSTGAELAARLRGLADGEAPAWTRRAGPAGPVGLVFAPHGSQWAGMGRALWGVAAGFTAEVEACDAALRAAGLGWSVVERVRGEGGSWLTAVDEVQPVLFALQLGVAAQLAAWGVEAAAVVGHSAGEAAAAVACGALTRAEGATVVVERTRVLRALRGAGGAMATVELGREAAIRAIGRSGQSVHIAACNGPRSLVLAGEADALEALLDVLAEEGVYCGRGVADVASHSPAMRARSEALADQLAGLRPRAERVAYYGGAAGGRVAGAGLGGAYWGRHLRDEVRFWDALAAAAGAGVRAFVEVGPHPLLATAMQDGLKDLSGEAGCLATLRRGEGAAALLDLLAGLYCGGSWSALDRLYPRGRVVGLPAYPWQRKRFWIDGPARAGGRGEHPLLGAYTSLAAPAGAGVWQQTLTRGRLGPLAEHAVHGVVLLPGAAFVELALAAGRAALGPGAVLEDIVIAAALTLGEDEARALQTVVLAEASGARQIVCASAGPGGAWLEHMRATARRGEAPVDGEAPAVVRARCPQRHDGASHRAGLAARGVTLGPLFHAVAAVHAGRGEVLAEIEIPDAVRRTLGAYGLHPGLLDACVQTMGAAAATLRSDEAAWLPVGLAQVRCAPDVAARVWAAAALWCHAQVEAAEGDELRGRLALRDAAGATLVEVAGFTARRMTPTRDAVGLYGLDWSERAPAAAPADGRWIVVADAGGLAGAVVAALRGLGGRCVQVSEETWSEEQIDGLLADGARAVIHVRGADAPGADADAAALARAREAGPASALRWARRLVARGDRETPRLWLVSRASQAPASPALPRAGDPDVAPVGAALWGLARALRHEAPGLRCGAIDVGAGDEAEVATLARVVAEDGDEDGWALRGALAWVPRLALRTCEEGRWSARADGGYVVTGGLGGLGLATARWLVERGARHLALVGRGAASAAAEAVISELRRAARVAVVQADVGDAARWPATAAALERALPKISGVFHAAGVLGDGVFTGQDATRLAAVMHPKLLGAWHLHRWAPDAVFVLFGSTAGLLGEAGQTTYAAANAWLAGLAHHRRARGRHALCVDWGPWADVGLAAARLAQGVGGGRGFVPFAAADGLRALAGLLAADATHAAVMTIDLRQWRETHLAAADARVLAGLGEAAPRRDAGPLRARLLAAGPGERRALVVAGVRAEVGAALRLEPDAIDERTPLRDLGVDSLRSLEIRNRLEIRFGVVLSATTLWNHGRVEALAELLLARIFPEVASDMSEQTGDAAAAAGLDELSEDELAAALAAELAELRGGGS